MNIQGLQKTTLLDYPGHVAATIFLGGCNFRCPFCHNMNLITESSNAAYSEEEVFSFLKKRQGILDGVCITGGEPTLCKDLPDFINKVRLLGYKIKLDTNGSNPEMLEKLISDGAVDYVAMDIKSSLSEYSKITFTDNINTELIRNSICILRASSIDYEFRTTMIKQYHSPSVMEEIGQLLNGCSVYYLQSFVDSEYVPNHELESFTKEELLLIQNQLSKYISKVVLRGID